MGRFAVRRAVAMVWALLVLTVLMFLLVQTVLGDPVVLMLGRDAEPETIARLRLQLGLERPGYLQYLDWLGRLLHGDWGRSFRTADPVLTTVLARLPVTLELAGLSLLLAVVPALALGVVAAARRRTTLDLCTSLLTSAGIAMPNFWIAILLILLCSLTLPLFPSAGFIPIREDPGGHLAHLVLPSLTLSAAYFANLARLTRTKMREALESDYVRAARARGLPEPRILGLHALRNSLLPVIGMLALSVSRLLGGAVVTETIFALPGIGVQLVDSILSRDLPVVQGVVVVVTVGVFVVNFFGDLLYAWMDPRIRITET